MKFDIIQEIANIEVIATGNSIKEIRRLSKYYGSGRWRKLKGTTMVKLDNNKMYLAEIHWYEAHGIGKREFKIKKLIR